MIYNTVNEYEAQKLREDTERAIKNQDVVEQTKKRLSRTLKQNAYLHLIIGWFACEYGCSIDEVKVDFYKRTCNKAIYERTRVNKQGKEVTYLRSSKDLDTEEMALSITRFRNWSSAIASIYLPSADEREFLLHVKQVIEYNKEFI
nr:hypothetical protein [uncultured Bacteroides sp.]